MTNYELREKRNNEKYGWNMQRLECINYILYYVLKSDDYWFTPTDIDYDDADYRYRYVEFKIKELPAWRFGLWLYDPEYNKDTKKYTKYFKGQLFAQVERFIDKFKPCRSSYCIDITFSPSYDITNEDGTVELENIEAELSGEYEIQDTLAFMLKEPALAFCRDVCGWNYNTTYHTRKEAERTMNKLIREWDISDANEKLMSDKVVDFCRNLVANRKLYFKDYITDAFLSAKKDGCSPERDLYLYWNNTEQKPGLYSFNLRDMTKEGFAYWISWKKEMRKLGRKLKVISWEFDTVDLYCISLTNDKKYYNRLKKKYDEKNLEKLNEVIEDE